MKIRVGQGIDIHPFAVIKRPFVLGGVEIAGVRGLMGHSDADALSHAICDAILGAANLGDMGQHFSDKDPKHKNQSSLFFLQEVAKHIEKDNWSIANIDSTVMTEAPMLSQYLPEMKNNIAQALGLEVAQVSIKATRAEKLGSIGRQEGLLAMANVLIFKS